MEPAGFLTAGFAHADTVYAVSDGTPSLAHGSGVTRASARAPRDG